MKRSKFSLGYTRLLSCDMGELVPIGLTEVLPGDTVQHATSALVRAAPLVSPVMHPVHVSIHHWFVPHRLVWTDWENFITGGPDGLNASVLPTISIVNPAIGSLADYLGVPTGTYTASVSALPFRAYAKVWNEFYRDQDLETALTIDLTDGADTTTNVTLQNCDWEKDYFTTCRPWEQKGSAVTVPLGTTAPVIGKEGSNTRTFERQGAGADLSLNISEAGGVAGTAITFQADLANASAVTVNVLRRALALQRFEEARARYGSRYTEYLRYLGVRSSDSRLQRPEYLGGGREVIQFSEVLQTGPGSDPVGDLKGHGIGALRSNRYRRFFEEHGFVLSLLSVRPKTIYANGLPRHWSRTTREDFFQKELAHIGQQAVLNKEVYAQHSAPGGTFGYQDRYDEYRRSESGVSGEFRSSVLDFWHMARIFTSEPALNASFVKCVPTERTFAVPSEDVIYVMARHSIQARRLVPAVGTSSIL